MQVRFFYQNSFSERSNLGGLTREWYSMIVEEIFNPRNGLFKLSNNQTSLQPHPSASAIPFHLQYLELAGIIVAKVQIGLIACEITSS